MENSKFDPFAAEVAADDTRIPCPYCGRRFATDRSDKHANTCEKNPEKMRAAAERKRGLAKALSGREYK